MKMGRRHGTFPRREGNKGKGENLLMKLKLEKMMKIDGYLDSFLMVSLLAFVLCFESVMLEVS